MRMLVYCKVRKVVAEASRARRLQRFDSEGLLG